MTLPLLELTAALLNKSGSAQPVKHISQGRTHPVRLLIQLVSPHLTHRVRDRKRKCWFQTSWMGHIFQQKLRQKSQTPMDLKARQKANASACVAKDTSASLSWKSKHTRDSVVVFTRTVKVPEELGKEKSSLVGAGFHRSYFEFPQPAGAKGRLIFHCSAP